MTRLLLVRHAQAAQPDDLRLPGPDLALLPEGVAQARAVADRLRAFAPAAIYSSDAMRARQTADVISAACHSDLHLTPSLREMDFGAWGGRTVAEVVHAEPSAAAWFANPAIHAPPGGESIAAVAARVRAFWETLAGDDASRVVVLVGHSGSFRLALADALGMPLVDYWRLRLDCASLSLMDVPAAGALTISQLNATSHLEPARTGDAETTS